MENDEGKRGILNGNDERIERRLQLERRRAKPRSYIRKIAKHIRIPCRIFPIQIFSLGLC